MDASGAAGSSNIGLPLLDAGPSHRPPWRAALLRRELSDFIAAEAGQREN